MSKKELITMRLFGTFSVYDRDAKLIKVGSKKALAVLATLACAPDGIRTRSWLQTNLWGRVEPEQASGSLRQAIHALKNALGDRADEIIKSEADIIRLLPESYQVIGKSSDGDFLEGINVGEIGFDNWLNGIRSGFGTVEKSSVLSSSITPSIVDHRPIEKFLGARISILPFQQISVPNGQNDVLGDMLAEEITRTLSRSRMFDIISHLSSRSFSVGRFADIAQISKDLNPDYVVTGTLRVHGDDFRLDLDFTDAPRNQLCWTETFGGSLKSFLQGNATSLLEASQAIAEGVVGREIEFAKIMPLPTVESHKLMMAAIGLMHRNHLRSFAQARSYLEELIKRHPQRADLRGWLAHWHIISSVQGWSEDAQGAAEMAKRLTSEALSFDPECTFCLTMDGFVNAYLLREFDIGFQRLTDAISQSRSNALATLFKGVCHAFIDDGAKAVELTERARALSPLDPQTYFFDTLAATAYLSAEDYEKSLTLADTSAQNNPRHVSTHRVRAISLHYLGRSREAKLAADEVLRRDRHFTVRKYLDLHPAGQHRTGQIWAKALLASGIPES